MNKIRVLLERRRNAKLLEHELLTAKYTWFNIKTSDYFGRQERKFDDLVERHLLKRMHGTKIELSDEAKQAIEDKKSIVRQHLSAIYNRVLGLKQEHKMTLDLKENIKAVEKLSLRAKALTYLQHYNEALESVVEGQREVLRDKDFKFEDGRTAEQKENMLRDFINKYR